VSIYGRYMGFEVFYKRTLDYMHVYWFLYKLL